MKVALSCIGLLSLAHGFAPQTSSVVPKARSASLEPLSLSLSTVVSNTAQRVRETVRGYPKEHRGSKIGKASFYDRDSSAWNSEWGEFSHHGYYDHRNRGDHVQAQVDMINQVLRVAGIGVDGQSYSNMVPRRMLDVGCGTGGATRYISRALGCSAVGVTASPYEARSANSLSHYQGMDKQVYFDVDTNPYDMEYQKDTFDLVWSMETAEKVLDKELLVDEMMRVATPGGKVVIATWCHRNTNRRRLYWHEKALLRKLNRYLPQPKHWSSMERYAKSMYENGGTEINMVDLSPAVAPLFRQVVRRNFGVWGLMRKGYAEQKGAFAMNLMLRAYNKGLIKFGVITCTKQGKGGVMLNGRNTGIAYNNNNMNRNQRVNGGGISLNNHRDVF